MNVRVVRCTLQSAEAERTYSNSLLECGLSSHLETEPERVGTKQDRMCSAGTPLAKTLTLLLSVDEE